MTPKLHISDQSHDSRTARPGKTGEQPGTVVKKGWQTEKLGEACSFLNRGISPIYVENGGIVVLNQRCIRDHRVDFKVARRHDSKAKGVRSERLVQTGDVLVNSTGEGTLGRVAQLRESPPEPTTVDSHVTIVRPMPGVFVREFFGYVLWDIEEKLKKSGEGCGGQTELNRAVLAENFLVRFPKPLPEQHRIVAILDDAFAAIATGKANAEKNLHNARALFESHLDSVFTRRGKGWVERRLGDVFDIGSSKRIRETEWTSSGVPFYGGKEIVRLAKSGSAVSDAYISEEKYREFASKYDMPRKGDVLITARGTIGVGYVVRQNDKFYYKDGNIIFLREKTPTNPHFILYAFRSRQLLDQIADLTGATVTHMPIERARELILHMPSFDIQNSVVEHLGNVESETQRLASIYDRKLAALESLKKSLLHQAFTGAL